eukprot:s905_g13.t1
MAIDPVDADGIPTGPKRPPKEPRTKQSQPKQFNHQKSGSGGCHSRIRKPVLALCKVTNAAAAAQPAKNLKAALLEAEQGNEPVDGGLLGMAAAQAGRLGLKDLLNTLCAYSWPRLSCCGGREVAELAAAASKCGCDDDRFFGFVAVYCCQYADAFGCLRDVALVATALTRKLDSKVDVASAFHGLTMVALKHLNTSRASYTQCPIRDIAEFFYSLVNLLGTSNGTALCASDAARDVIVAMATSVRPQLHKASAQDIAKTTGAASMAWTLFPQLQDQVLMPLLQELAQAVRFRHTDFNAQDVAHLSVAFAKVDGIPDFSTSLPVLLDKVLDNLAVFSSKDLSLVSWAASRSQYIGERCSGHVTKEVMRRDLSAFSAQDLCMLAQCLAKMGGRGKDLHFKPSETLSILDTVRFICALKLDVSAAFKALRFLPLLFTLAAAHSFLNSNEVTEDEVQQSLMDNLVTDALLPTYNALPKNSQGLIDHQAVRYVLHRMFVQKYGWYIKGLEPSGDHWHEETPEKPEVAKVKEWVPTYLQDLLEKRLHHKGLDLKGLVQLALSLEDLVSHEAKNRLKTAYEIHDFPTILGRIFCRNRCNGSGEMARIEADDVVRTWYVSFLLAGNFSASSPEEDWQDADNWLGELEKEHYQGVSAPTFESNSDLVQKIGERSAEISDMEKMYFHFNDGECRALKATMQDMEGKKAGRVRLSTFYKKSLYSHWRFTEKADYLRRLGALDDSDPQQPQVIMANYMMARPNCLEASGLPPNCRQEQD